MGRFLKKVLPKFNQIEEFRLNGWYLTVGYSNVIKQWCCWASHTPTTEYHPVHDDKVYHCCYSKNRQECIDDVKSYVSSWLLV